MQYKDKNTVNNNCTLHLNHPTVMCSFSTALVLGHRLFSVVPTVCVSSTLLLRFYSKQKSEIVQSFRKRTISIGSVDLIRLVRLLNFLTISLQLRAGIAQSRLATGWTVRGSNPGGGGAKFSAPVQTALRPTQPPIQWVVDLSRG